MFNPFLTLWIFFSIATILLIVYIFFYFNLIGGFTEIYWKVIYVFTLLLTLLLVFFFSNEILLSFFLNKVNEVIIIKDLQDIVNISLELSVIFSLYFVIPITVLFWRWYFNSYLTKIENKTWIYLYLLFYYYYICFILILNNDLFLSSWEFFNSQENRYKYDFQPDLVFIILSYIGDFYDLGFYFILILSYIGLVLRIQYYIPLSFFKNRFYIYVRIIFHFLLGFLAFYFFGGESIYRDVFIIVTVFFIFEIFYLFSLFLYNIKRKVV